MKSPGHLSAITARPYRVRGRGGLPFGLLLLLSAVAAGCNQTPEEPAAAEETKPEGDSRLDQLSDSASALLDTIRDQESSRDATCWSSVRMIEGFSLGRQLTPPAEVARIEVTRALLAKVWLRASAGKSGQLGLKDVQSALPEAVRKAKEELEVAAARAPGTGPQAPAAQGMADQQQTTENWRALLSLTLTEGLTARGLAPLSPGAAEQLAKASTAMTSLVLQAAAEAAEKAHREKVTLEDVQAGYRSLAGSWFPGEEKKPQTSKTEATSAGIDKDAFLFVRKSTTKNAAGKLAALARYNRLEKAPSFKEAGQLAPYLSKVIGMTVGPSGAMEIAEELKLFARVFLAEHGPLRSDTFSDSYIGLEGTKSRRRYITLADIFNATQSLFPTRKLANADAEVLMTRNIIPKEGGPSVIDERRVTMEAPALDATRDTGIHWLALQAALNEEKNVALDPFAAELLSETLSEYAYFLLEGSVRGAAAMKQTRITRKLVERLPWKYPQGRFFPVEEPVQERQEPSPPPPVKPNFREHTVPDSVARAAAESCTKLRKGFQAFMGSGIGVGDYDDDGKPDLFVAADGCNRLLKNEGRFQFKDVTMDLGLSGIGKSSRHPIFVDVNGDGQLDLFVTQSDEKSLLYIQEDGKFANRTTQWGLSSGRSAHSAHFFDYDRDGDLDLFVGRYGTSKGNTATPTLDGRNGNANQLFRNDGDKFVNVSEGSGLASTGWTLASAAVDIDQDGYLDVWIANDFGRDQVFRNLGNGKFEEIAASLGTDDRGSGMNVSVLDLNRDERPDVFVSMIEMFSKTLRFVLPHGKSSFEVDDRVLSSSYYISGMKLFVSKNAQRGAEPSSWYADGSSTHIDTGRKGWAWGAAAFDYDLDGDEDVYLANGWIEKSAFHKQYNQFMVNQDARLSTYGPTATHRETADEGAKPPSSPLGYAGSSRAVVAVDLNGSGKQDVVAVDYRGGLRVFENTSRAKGSDLRVRLRGAGKNTHGIGATVTVRLDTGAPLLRYASAGSDYLSQHDQTLFFGIPNGAKVTEVEVSWASGKSSNVDAPQTDSTLEITED